MLLWYPPGTVRISPCAHGDRPPLPTRVHSAAEMPGSTHNAALRGRIETVIQVASPLHDLVLAVGDRVSRMLERDDPDYELARMQFEGESAPRGLRPRG
jgi:hypothetical protein